MKRKQVQVLNEFPIYKNVWTHGNVINSNQPLQKKKESNESRLFNNRIIFPDGNMRPHQEDTPVFFLDRKEKKEVVTDTIPDGPLGYPRGNILFDSTSVLQKKRELESKVLNSQNFQLQSSFPVTSQTYNIKKGNNNENLSEKISQQLQTFHETSVVKQADILSGYESVRSLHPMTPQNRDVEEKAKRESIPLDIGYTRFGQVKFEPFYENIQNTPTFKKDDSRLFSPNEYINVNGSDMLNVTRVFNLDNGSLKKSDNNNLKALKSEKYSVSFDLSDKLNKTSVFHDSTPLRSHTVNKQDGFRIDYDSSERFKLFESSLIRKPIFEGYQIGVNTADE